jgi:hypothetical protein
MLETARNFSLAICGLLLVGCSRSTDSALIGEWTSPTLEPNTRVTYDADHTYYVSVGHPGEGNVFEKGTWRVEGSRIICRSEEQGESKAEILKIGRNHLQIKGPDGVVSNYERVN